MFFLSLLFLEINAEEYSAASVSVRAQITSSQTVASLVLNTRTVSAELVFVSLWCINFYYAQCNV